MKLKKGLSILTAIAMTITSVLTGVSLKPLNVQAAESAPNEPQYRNVMYYGDWSIYAGQNYFYVSKIDGSLITHLNFAFLDVEDDGSLTLCDEHADFLNANDSVQSGITYGDPYAGVLGSMAILRQKYPNMKIGISVGGWTRTGSLPVLARNASTREAFAKNIAKFVDYLGFDFVDIDWEYPGADREPDPEGNGVTIDKGCKGGPEDTVNYTLTLQAIRDELDKLEEKDGKHYELSIAMSASPAMMDFVEYDKVMEIVDFANMMTYDLNGAWNGYTAHQTALYTNPAYNPETQKDGVFSVDYCIQYLKTKYGDKIDYSKIVIGVAPYTRGWKDVQNDGPIASLPGFLATGTGENGVTYAYGDIENLKSQYNLTEYWDDTAKASYFYGNGHFFTCDTERSVEEKGKYVKENNLGGLISWMASLDSANSITKTMKNSLYGDEELPAQEIIVTNPNVSVTVSKSGDSTYSFVLKNNEQMVETNTALKDAEAFKKTVTFPKLYIKTNSGATFSVGSECGTVTNSNGVAVVDLAGVYAAKALKAGSSHTFTLNVSGTADVDDIVGITMTRRIKSDLPEFGQQAVYGEGFEAEIPDSGTEDGAGDGNEDGTGDGNESGTEGDNNSDLTVDVPAWSDAGVAYAVGDLVSHEGKVYEVVIAHTSNWGWPPNGGGATLFKERTDLTPGSGSGSGGSGGSGSETPNPGENNYYVNGTLPQHMVTGYWHNFCNGSVNLRLSDVPTYYDMICVAFTGNTATAGEVTFELDPDLCRALGGYTEADFINDIKTVKERGQHVIISVGGAEGRITINSEAAADKFAEGMIAIIKKYGFEGVDIDLEGGAVAGTAYIASALRKVHDEFGKDFIITMAPETAYIMNSQGAYAKLAIEIKDILTICYPQFYNTGSMNGYQGNVVNPASVEMPTSMSYNLMAMGLRADQVAFGFPCMSSAGGNYTSIDNIKTAVNAFVNGTNAGSFKVPEANPTFRGVMTWSINWDATQDYAWAKEMAALMDTLADVDNGSTDSDDGSDDGSGANGGSGANNFAISKQPKPYTGMPGQKAEFTVTAEGTGLTYQWQERKNSTDTWKNSSATGNKTATLSVDIAKGMNGYEYRCVVTSEAQGTLTTNAAILTVELPTPVFADVTVGTWEHTAAVYVVNKGVMKGTNVDKETGIITFKPGEPLTREQFVQILYSAEGKPAVTYSEEFSDVPEDEWYAYAVSWAKELGITAGKGDGTFGVGDNITRQDLATMLKKYAEMKGYDTVATTDISAFVDAADIASYAVDPIKWANANGIISGMPADKDGTIVKLAPWESATRAQAAAMMKKFLEKFATE